MTITTDLDAALAVEEDKVRHGKRVKPSRRWRMGPSALAALAAENRAAVEAMRYRDIPIEEVPPPGRDEEQRNSAEAFMGWELRA